jgi:hypothetical protein
MLYHFIPFFCFRSPAFVNRSPLIICIEQAPVNVSHAPLALGYKVDLSSLGCSTLLARTLKISQQELVGASPDHGLLYPSSLGFLLQSIQVRIWIQQHQWISGHWNNAYDEGRLAELELKHNI